MDKLKAYADSFNGNQTDLAELIGVSRPYLSLLLSGKKRPSLSLAGEIEKRTNGAVPVSSWLTSEPAE